MPTNEWKECTLGDFVTLQRGFDLPSSKRISGEVPIVSSSGVTGYHNEAKASPPGVVTGRYGTIGQVFYLDMPYWPLNTTLWCRDFKGNLEKFAYYLLHTIDYHSCSDKAAVPGVNRNHLHEIPIKIPPLEEQKAIAAILGALDDKIELNRRMNETLEAMARAVFKSWFVDFDPVRAKMEGRTPHGMDAATAALFPDSFQDSPLGPIPTGWEAKPLPEIVEVKPKRSLKKGSMAPYVEMKMLPTSGSRVQGWIEREFTSVDFCTLRGPCEGQDQGFAN